MTFDELLQEIDTLPKEQLQLLQQHIAQRVNAEAKIAALRGAVAALREGLSEVQITEMAEAMNKEYIEPLDENEWQA